MADVDAVCGINQTFYLNKVMVFSAHLLYNPQNYIRNMVRFSTVNICEQICDIPIGYPQRGYQMGIHSFCPIMSDFNISLCHF